MGSRQEPGSGLRTLVDDKLDICGTKVNLEGLLMNIHIFFTWAPKELNTRRDDIITSLSTIEYSSNDHSDIGAPLTGKRGISLTLFFFWKSITLSD